MAMAVENGITQYILSWKCSFLRLHEETQPLLLAAGNECLLSRESIPYLLLGHLYGLQALLSA